MIIKKTKIIPRTLENLYYKALKASYSNYQSFYKKGSPNKNERECDKRWEIIKPTLISLSPKSLLDLGSGEGYFTLRTADELGISSIGIDSDKRRLSLAYLTLMKEKIVNAGFMQGDISPNFISTLPSFDIVLCMSLLHHILVEKGESYAKILMEKIRNKTGKAMIFEMGESNENMSWAKKLPDMGENPHKWIEEFLYSCGFRDVKKIGESDSYNKELKRAIFVATT